MDADLVRERVLDGAQTEDTVIYRPKTEPVEIKNPDIKYGELQTQKLEFSDKPKVEMPDFENIPSGPIVRFFCAFPTTYPDGKKFGLQFTCLRSEEDGKKLVIRRNDEFGTMDRHTIDHEDQLFPYSVERANEIAYGGVVPRDVITVVLSHDEFVRLLGDLTSDEEITMDVSRQIAEAARMRAEMEEMKKGFAEHNIDVVSSSTGFEDINGSYMDSNGLDSDNFSK